MYIVHAHTHVQIVFHLPSQAVSRDWHLIYSTFKHGISLKTLYRNMMMFENEDSPILLVVRDEHKKVVNVTPDILAMLSRPQWVLSLTHVDP